MNDISEEDSGEQEQQLDRVRGKLQPMILDFYHQRLSSEPKFFAADLRRFIASQSLVAPASPDRVLRDLRQRRKLNYRVLNRAASQYEALPIEEVASTQ